MTFDFDGDAVRTMTEDGEPLFNGRDVCRCLGLETPQRAFDRIPDEEKGVRSTHTLGGEQAMVWLYESGLYRLIFESRKPEAERFKRWVFHDVLPAIRRTGSYSRRRLDPVELGAALAVVREARRVHGVEAARSVWADLGLPEVPDPIPVEEGADPGAFLSAVQAFIAECTDARPFARVQATVLHEAYQRWAADEHAPALTITMFGRLMRRAGHLKVQASCIFYLGLQLRADARGPDRSPFAEGMRTQPLPFIVPKEGG
ncbi:BRO-N domain-containing protein [Mangrovicella endophytica]|uniref:BRO-N domain-containing protein n=1 Tax=Mangrovicella endophytica TaxID=2066697 RepID=UPI0018E49215|nr:BRO family protein [Mangrovicella endophytica]